MRLPWPQVIESPSGSTLTTVRGPCVSLAEPRAGSSASTVTATTATTAPNTSPARVRHARPIPALRTPASAGARPPNPEPHI